MRLNNNQKQWSTDTYGFDKNNLMIIQPLAIDNIIYESTK